MGDYDNKRYDLTLVFPCGTEKEYSQVTHIKGVKLGGKRPVLAIIYGSDLCPGIPQILHPHIREIVFKQPKEAAVDGILQTDG
jgi:hypothetical protein